MSLISIKKTLRRDSLSDRICDDLCEVLLSYLSFEDKIRFECVSQQFQRLIFNKQYVFVINNRVYDKRNNLNVLLDLIKHEKSSVFRKINLKAFESVLKKCKFINTIIIENFIIDSEEQVLKVISNNCLYLKSIKFNFSRIRDKYIEYFGRKCGQKLRDIEFVDKNSNYKKPLSFCPNLVSIKDLNISQVMNETHLLIPNIISSRVLYHLNDKQFIKAFVDKYRKTLKVLDIIIERDVDQNAENLLLNSICLLDNLEKINIKFSNNSFNQTFANFKNKFKFSKIKSFSITHFTSPSNAIQLYKSMNCLKQLQYLELNIDVLTDVFGEDITAKQLTDCKLLTHLKLKSLAKINDHFFTDIDLYLPKIKFLDIIVVKISDKTMNSLSLLNDLKKIRLKSNRFNGLVSITDTGVCNVMSVCHSIQSIIFENQMSLTHITIDGFISLAFRRPNTQFCHQLITSPEVFHYYKNLKNLPKNLLLKIYNSKTYWL